MRESPRAIRSIGLLVERRGRCRRGRRQRQREHQDQPPHLKDQYCSRGTRTASRGVTATTGRRSSRWSATSTNAAEQRRVAGKRTTETMKNRAAWKPACEPAAWCRNVHSRFQRSCSGRRRRRPGRRQQVRHAERAAAARTRPLSTNPDSPDHAELDQLQPVAAVAQPRAMPGAPVGGSGRGVGGGVMRAQLGPARWARVPAGSLPGRGLPTGDHEHRIAGRR